MELKITAKGKIRFWFFLVIEAWLDKHGRKRFCQNPVPKTSKTRIGLQVKFQKSKHEN